MIASAHRLSEKLGWNQMFCKFNYCHVAHKITYRGAFWGGNLSLFGPKLAIFDSRNLVTLTH